MIWGIPVPPINRRARIHHVNRSAEITKRTFRLISPKRCDSFASFSGNTETWARYATAKKSQSTVNRPEMPPSDDMAAARQHMEPRSRAEYAADLERQVALVTFEPRRAGLPEISIKDATAYLDKHHVERPWLSVARDCPPEVQRMFAALDQGRRSRAHPARRLGHRGDERAPPPEPGGPRPARPGQTRGRDRGLTAGDIPHRCGDIASRIIDPEIFAAAFARGVEHPDVRAALNSNGSRPEPVILPISDVLGDDGHKFCSGWQLEPVNGSMEEARAVRRAWAADNQSGPEPQAGPVETFDGGTVTFAFRRGAVGSTVSVTVAVFRSVTALQLSVAT